MRKTKNACKCPELSHCFLQSSPRTKASHERSRFITEVTETIDHSRLDDPQKETARRARQPTLVRSTVRPWSRALPRGNDNHVSNFGTHAVDRRRVGVTEADVPASRHP
jgi:hypothetical protein